MFAQLRQQWQAFCHGQQQSCKQLQLPQLSGSARETRPQRPAILGPGQQQQRQALAPVPQLPEQQQQQRQQQSNGPRPQTWQPQRGTWMEPAAAAATARPAAACSGAACPRRGRRAQGLSIRSRPRRARGFRLRRRLVVRQGASPAVGGKAAGREWWASSGRSSSGGDTDDDGAGSCSGPESGGAPGSAADSGAGGRPGSECGCTAGSRLCALHTSMPCGDSHCSSSSCSVCSGGDLTAYVDQRQCDCRPPSSASQVRLPTNRGARRAAGGTCTWKAGLSCCL